MRFHLPRFGLALHATLAFELTRLVAEDEAFERLWSRPRRTTLSLAVKVLSLASLAALTPSPNPPARARTAPRGSARPGA